MFDKQKADCYASLATTEIYKAVTTMFRMYKVEMVNPAQKLKTRSLGVLDIEEPLMVKVTKRA